MKRYRYLSSQRTGWRKYLPLMYFFSAWNVFGAVIWMRMTNKIKKDHPDFDEMTPAQKAALMYTGGTEGSINKVRISGFNVMKEESTTEDFLKVKKEEH